MAKRWLWFQIYSNQKPLLIACNQQFLRCNFTIRREPHYGLKSVISPRQDIISEPLHYSPLSKLIFVTVIYTFVSSLVVYKCSGSVARYLRYSGKFNQRHKSPIELCLDPQRVRLCANYQPFNFSPVQRKSFLEVVNPSKRSFVYPRNRIPHA